jgi:hypothetical protein
MVGMPAAAEAASRHRSSVASRPARVNLSGLNALVMGFFFMAPRQPFSPMTIPAWGAPSSLSPLKDMTSKPFFNS